ncbi:MAG: coenzyme F420-0:L-glutamate ligase [Actinobacteria bacterium]|nr:coenzyme F420-0:L-glutamate ligase [Actinomycetota bacterium]
MAAVEAVTIYPVEGIPEVRPGDDLAKLIAGAVEAAGLEVQDGDVLVVTHKIVSKAEGRIAKIPPGDDDAKLQIVMGETARVVRQRGGLLIAETKHGFVCANAGVDSSNVEEGTVTLLPVDPDRSARGLRKQIKRLTGASVAVVITDTWGRAWRIGQTNFAIGVAGMLALNDHRGKPDHFGRIMSVTSIAIADEIASAAELVMGKSERIPVALIRGLQYPEGKGRARSLVRDPQSDLFR